MGLVYLPTFTIKINQNVGKYIIHGMDPMGLNIQEKYWNIAKHRLINNTLISSRIRYVRTYVCSK